MMETPKVLMVSEESEGANFRGGLGRAVFGLTRGLRRQGVDARILVLSKDGEQKGKRVGGTSLYKTEVKKVPIYIDTTWGFFQKQRNSPITYPLGNITFEDMVIWRNYARNFPVNLAELRNREGFVPNVLHLHDWPMAFIAQYAREDRTIPEAERRWQGMKTVFTIHNRAYDGRVMLTGSNVAKLIKEFSLSDVPMKDFFERFCLDGIFSMQKLGVRNADLATTVSNQYARYLQQVGETLDVQFGVAGGLDERIQDVFWEAKFEELNEISPTELAEIQRIKRTQKIRMLAQHGIYDEGRKDIQTPIFALIARLDAIKGVERVLDILPDIKDAVIFIGGPVRDKNIEARLHAAKKEYQGKHIIQPEFLERDEVSRVLKASDYFLAPSWLMPEPDGFSVREAMVHLALPLVAFYIHAYEGGYQDLIDRFQKIRGINGRNLPLHTIASDCALSPENAKYYSKAIAETIGEVTEEFQKRPERRQDRIEAMVEADRQGIFSFGETAGVYNRAYERLLTPEVSKQENSG